MGFCHIVACICLAIGESDNSKAQVVSLAQPGVLLFQRNTSLARSCKLLIKNHPMNRWEKWRRPCSFSTMSFSA